MSDRSGLDPCHRGIYTHHDNRADEIRHQMWLERHDVVRAVAHLENISAILLQRVKSHLSETEFTLRTTAVYVMRGGLIMRPPYERVFPRAAAGLVVSYRPTLSATPRVVYGNIPHQFPEGFYLLLDLIIASGATMLAVLESMNSHIGLAGGGENRILIVCPFATEVGARAILANFPGVRIHAIWTAEGVDANNRMTGVGFDIGDYAFGGSCEHRVQWA